MSEFNYITQEGLANIKNHKYKSGELSYLDAFVTKQSTHIVNLLPTTLAPNMITLIGFLIQIQSSIILYTYQNYLGGIPQWAFFNCVVSLFIYQIMDILDGKQARRINKSSPLGQLFDHGLDCLSSSSLLYNTCVALNVFDEVYLVRRGILLIVVIFYTAQYGEFVTGILHTQAGGVFGVVEIHYILMTKFFVTGLYGQEIWRTQVLGYELTQVISILYLIGSSLIMLTVWYEAYTLFPLEKFLRSLFPVCSIFLCTFILFKFQNLENYLHEIFWTINFIYNRNCIKLIICTMSKMKFDLVHLEVTILYIFTLLLFIVQSQKALVGVVTILFCLLSLYNLVSFGYGCAHQIAKTLEIKILFVQSIYIQDQCQIIFKFLFQKYNKLQ